MQGFNEEPTEARRNNTLLWIVIGVILVAMIILIPRYLQHVKATMVYKQLIYNYVAARNASEDNDGHYWPDEVVELVDLGYLELDESLLLRWQFEIDDKKAFVARMVETKPGAEPKVVRFDITTMTLTGFGLPKKGRHVDEEDIQKVIDSFKAKSKMDLINKELE